MSSNQTIFALSTGAVPSAIAVVRVSGPLVKNVLKRLVGKIPKARHMVYSEILSPETQEILDIGLSVFFPAKQSITGEDTAEFHVHGSVAVLNDLLFALSSFSGLRLAEPGEFTKKALMNGKMELTQVEALADLIAAETKNQRIQAVKQIKGGLSKRYNSWKKKLVNIRARVEASLDFVEEQDVVDNASMNGINKDIKLLIERIDGDIKKGALGERLRRGLKIVLIGLPNVGKSSLINLLLKEERAIVTSTPGTTRDVLEARLNLNNIPVTIYDTAGIRESSNDIEKEGVKRAKKAAEEADIVLAVFDLSKKDDADVSKYLKNKHKIIKVYNKSDLAMQYKLKNKESLKISCLKKQGIKELLEVVGKKAEFLTGGKDFLGPNRIRHILHLNSTKEALGKSLTEMQKKNYEIAADFLRTASTSLGRIAGEVDIEDVLDELFSGFCVGK